MTDVKDMTAEELARYGTIPPRIRMTAMEEAAAHEILVRLTELTTLRADNARLKKQVEAMSELCEEKQGEWISVADLFAPTWVLSYREILAARDAAKRIVYLDEREKIIEHAVPAKPYGNILWERLEAAAKKVLD